MLQVHGCGLALAHTHARTSLGAEVIQYGSQLKARREVVDIFSSAMSHFHTRKCVQR